MKKTNNNSFYHDSNIIIIKPSKPHPKTRNKRLGLLKRSRYYSCLEEKGAGILAHFRKLWPVTFKTAFPY